MSTVIEAIVVPAVIRHIHIADADMPFDVLSIEPGKTVLVRPARARFSEAVSTIAASLSQDHGTTLVIRWDDRVGHRSSEVFQNGECVEAFGADDELYAVLDEDGNPKASDGLLSSAEVEHLPEEMEVEVVRNAIQMGCEVSALCDWSDIRRRILELP